MSGKRNLYYQRGGNLTRAIRSKKNGKRTKSVMDHKFVIANINPFDARAYGARIPDSSTAPSVPFFFYDNVSLSAAANTSNCTIIRAVPNAMNITAVPAGVPTPTNWQWQAAYGGRNQCTSAASSINVNTACRSVAHGIRITCGNSLTQTSGYVHIGLYSENMASSLATWSGPTQIAHMASLPGYQKLTLASLIERPYIYVNKFTSCSAFEYRAPNEISTSAGNTQGIPNVAFGFMSIYIAVETPAGAAVAGSIQIENVIHQECQQDYAAGGTTRRIDAECPNQPVLDATSVVNTDDNPMVEDNPTSLRDRFNSAASRVCDVLSTEAAEYAMSLVPDEYSTPLRTVRNAACGYTGRRSSSKRVVNRSGRKSLKRSFNKAFRQLRLTN